MVVITNHQRPPPTVTRRVAFQFLRYFNAYLYLHDTSASTKKYVLFRRRWHAISLSWHISAEQGYRSPFAGLRKLREMPCDVLYHIIHGFLLVKRDTQSRGITAGYIAKTVYDDFATIIYTPRAPPPHTPCNEEISSGAPRILIRRGPADTLIGSYVLAMTWNEKIRWTFDSIMRQSF